MSDTTVVTETVEQYVARVEAEYRQTVVAVAVLGDDYDQPFDGCFTWETGEQYASDGHVVTALAADGHVDVETAQARYDASLAAHRDCFAS